MAEATVFANPVLGIGNRITAIGRDRAKPIANSLQIDAPGLRHRKAFDLQVKSD